MVKPRGPHQRTRCSGSIQTLKTRSRGAAKMRVSSSTRSAGGVAGLFPVLAATGLLLGLQRAQIVAQAIKALVPEPAVVVEPVGGILERAALKPAGPPLRLAPADDQPGPL